MPIRENCFSCQRFKHLTAWKFNIILTGHIIFHFPFARIWPDSPLNLSFFPYHLVHCLTSILSCWGTKFSNHRNGFLWWKTHNERGWISIVGRMQLNKHYAAQTQWYLESYSKSPSVLARCWRLIRDSALKELFFILSVPLPMKETVGRQWPKEIEKHLPLW